MKLQYTLCQALQIAGFESFVATLWKTAKRETAQPIRDFFSNWLMETLAKHGWRKSLRAASVVVPLIRFFGAAFTMTGN